MPSRKRRKPQTVSFEQICLPINPGCEVRTDSGLPVIRPNPNENDLYIGRLVTGTSSLVRQLKESFNPDYIIEAHGQLVLPYMWRRQLAHTADSERIVGKALDSVFDTSPKVGSIATSGAYVAEQKSGKEYAVRMRTNSPLRTDLRVETERVTDVLRQELDSDRLTDEMGLIVRAFSTPSRQEAIWVATTINEAQLSGTMLTLPVVCGVPKKID